MSGFQTTMYNQPAPAIEGDWCSANPRYSMLAGAGELKAGPNGVSVGRFAWADPSGIVSNSGGVGRLGFVGKDQVVLNPLWLEQAGLVVQAGLDVTLYSSADVWCRFAGGATQGQKVYANYADGTALSAVTGSPPQAASFTAAIAENTAVFTASIGDYVTGLSGNLMTVSAMTSGTIIPGSVISAGAAAGTVVLSQQSGTTGGVGVYIVSQRQIVASTSMTTEYGTMTVSAVASGALGVGDLVAGTSVPAGTQVIGLGTGLGGTGTYYVNCYAVVASEAMTATGAVETNWYVETYCGPGELAKISTRS